MRADLAVIVNPIAGHGRTATVWPRVAAALGEVGLAFDATPTTGPGHASSLAAEALRSGYRTIVAVGGDGTVNEVVNGMLSGGEQIDPDVRLGVISSGTGCDLVRSLGLHRDEDAVPVLKNGLARPIDVGRVAYRDLEGRECARYFLNVADMGLGGEAAEMVNQSSKALGGFLSFLYGAVAAILRYQNKTMEYTLDDGQTINGKVSILVVANGRYFAGGMNVAPRAKLDDGLFDVIILEATGKADLIFSLLPSVYRGAHLGHPTVRYTTARKVTVRSVDRALLETDGEQLGRDVAEFTIVPQALRVAAPHL